MAVVSEVTNFKALVRTWLLGISGMSTLIGSRLYNGWPAAAPTQPTVSYQLPHRRWGDYPFPSWQGELELALHATKSDDLDQIEDLIIAWLGDDNNSVQTTLSDGVVECKNVEFVEVSEDDPTLSIENDRCLFLTRFIRMNVGFIGVA